jgi:hypothetical protein
MGATRATGLRGLVRDQRRGVSAGHTPDGRRVDDGAADGEGGLAEHRSGIAPSSCPTATLATCSIASIERSGTANGMALSPTQDDANSMTFYLDKADEVLKAITDARNQGIPIGELGKEWAKVVEYKELANHSASARWL